MEAFRGNHENAECGESRKRCYIKAKVMRARFRDADFHQNTATEAFRGNRKNAECRKSRKRLYINAELTPARNHAADFHRNTGNNPAE